MLYTEIFPGTTLKRTNKGVTTMPHYYMFHKPFGCVTARRDDRYPTVMDYFKELHNDRLSPVGRLDRETTGLLLITDDGIFNQKLTHPSYHKEKTYEFTLLGDLTPELVHKLETGVILKGADTLTAPAKITVTGHAVMSDILSTLPEEIQKDIHKNRPDHSITYGIITISEGKNTGSRPISLIRTMSVWGPSTSIPAMPRDLAERTTISPQQAKRSSPRRLMTKTEPFGACFMA